jgi:RNA polymerase sigma factor (sigma-70 family)
LEQIPRHIHKYRGVSNDFKSDQSDEQITRLMREPQTMEEGLKLLMQKYQSLLYRHLQRMVNNHEDANDLLQNCFIKAFRHIGQFEGKSRLSTWLFRIAANEALSFLQNKQRRATDSLEERMDYLGSTLRADASVDGDAATALLEEVLKTLPPKQKLVFTLRYYDELPYEEMSRVLNTSECALKASYHHAVKKIEHLLKEKQPNYE